MRNKIILLATLAVFLNSCQTVKDGLTGRKTENSDEFLVEKKNPLEIPPDFNELPVPKTEMVTNNSEKIDKEIEKLLEISGEEVESVKNTNKSAEDFVLKEINRN